MKPSWESVIQQAAEVLRGSASTVAFTGAGISVESGIPAFRGDSGLWNTYDPHVLELGYFMTNAEQSWRVIREIFYDHFGHASPNSAHFALSRMEQAGLLEAIITQNIDNLHQEAGSRVVYEFHGNSKHLVCMGCSRHYSLPEISLNKLPPLCPHCNRLLKPDFVFFGERIPQAPLRNAFEAVMRSSVLLVIGTTGEVMPANQIPPQAKANGAVIIEVNPEPSNYTDKYTDIFLQGKATEVMSRLESELFPTPLDNN